MARRAGRRRRRGTRRFGDRFVWLTNLLPNDLAPYITEMMERGTNEAKETFDSSSAPVT